MATIHPFVAHRYSNMAELGTRLLARSVGLEETRTAPGGLVVDGPKGYYLLELLSTAGADARRPFARFVLCALSDGDGALELEETDSRPERAGSDPVVALAADDRQVLYRWLGEVPQERPPDWEARAMGQTVHLWRLGTTSLTRRIAAHLSETQLRTLRPVPRRGPCLAAVASLADPGLALLPIHRGIREVPTFHPERFLTVVGGYARVHDLEERIDTPQGLRAAQEHLASMAAGTHAVLLVLPGGEGKVLRFRQRLDEAQIKAAPKNPTLRALDLALLNSMVLRTVLGVVKPEALDQRQVFAVPTLPSLVKSVQEGWFQAGFALNPPPLWEIRAVMEAGAKLPRLTLTVDPEPPGGLLFLGPEG